MWLSASVPPVRPTVTSSLSTRCSVLLAIRRPSGGRPVGPGPTGGGALRQRVASGRRPGGVAEDGPPVGAAWLRLLPEHDRGYGFVDAETPELSIGVVPTHRGRGIGSLLLEALVGSAREQRHEALSLSVEPDNPGPAPVRALRLQGRRHGRRLAHHAVVPLMLQLSIGRWDFAGTIDAVGKRLWSWP